MQYPTGNRPPPELTPSRTHEQASKAAGAGTRFRGLIWRPRLAEALDAGTRRAVTLICAGPGWGKTALAASWAEARAIYGPTALLTLDAQHNDPRAFWSDFMLA